MCYNNFHKVLFSSCHLTTTVIFLWFWSFHGMSLCCDCVPLFFICHFFSTTGIRVFSSIQT